MKEILTFRLEVEKYILKDKKDEFFRKYFPEK